MMSHMHVFTHHRLVSPRINHFVRASWAKEDPVLCERILLSVCGRPHLQALCTGFELAALKVRTETHNSYAFARREIVCALLKGTAI